MKAKNKNWEAFLASWNTTEQELNMAFGDNYKPVYEAPTIPDGEYLARIEKAELDTFSKGSGDEYVRVILAIKDHPGYNPNSIFLTEAPKLGAIKANGQPVTQDDVDRANRQLTTFFLCFGIKEGDFDLSHWKGHTGTVKVAPQYDKNEPDKKSKVYKSIWPQKPKEEKKAAETNVAKPTQSTTVAQSAQASSTDSFPEDIPF
jgi:hypothetical protein